jgi:hypothetical protein
MDSKALKFPYNILQHLILHERHNEYVFLNTPSTPNNERTAKEKLQNILFPRHNTLLLGCGESGKATLYKQMKSIFNCDTFHVEEREHYKHTIYANVFHTLYFVDVDIVSNNVILSSPELHTYLNEISILVQENNSLILSAANHYTVEMHDKVKKILQCPMFQLSLKNVMEIYNVLRVPYGVSRFMKNIDRLHPTSFKPNLDDILCSRRKTTGIVQVQSKFLGTKLRVSLTGGQRNERKKWIHLYEGECSEFLLSCINFLFIDISVILNVVSIAEYDLLCYEDEATNRTLESLNCFEDIISRFSNNPSKPLIFLVLNQVDIFEQKYFKSSPSKYFDDFSYEQYPKVEDGMQYMASKFKTIFKRYYGSKELTIFFTNALDCNDVKEVLEGVTEVLEKQDSENRQKFMQTNEFKDILKIVEAEDPYFKLESLIEE